MIMCDLTRCGFLCMPRRIGADMGGHWEVVGKSGQKGWSEIGVEKVGERLVDELVENGIEDSETTSPVPSLKTRENVREITGEGIEKGVEKRSEKENIIIRLIKENPKISKQEISEKGNISKKSVEYNIALLTQPSQNPRV